MSRVERAEKIRHVLLWIVTATVLVGVVGSAAHLVDMYATVSRPPIAMFLAVGTVFGNIALILFEAIREQKHDWRAVAGILVLLLIEFTANLFGGAAYARGHMPAALSLVLPASSPTGLAYFAAILWSATIPVLNIICSALLGNAIRRILLEDARPTPVNVHAQNVLRLNGITDVPAPTHDAAVRNNGSGGS